MDQTLKPFKKLAANSLFAAISEVSIGFLFLLFILAARYLGDEQFGIFSFALAFVNIFGIVNDLGLRYVYVREVARQREQAERYLSNVMVIEGGLSLVMIILVVVGINLLPNTSPTSILVVYLLAGAEVLRSAKFLFRFAFRAVDHFELESVTVLFERITLLVVGLVVLVMGYDVVAFALAFLVVRLVDVLFSLLVLVRGAVRPSLPVDFALWPLLLRKAAPFALSGVVMLLFFKVSTVMLSVLRSDAEVGWYSAAYKLIEGLVLVPAIFSSSLYPSISRLHDDRSMVVSLFQRGVKYILLAALPMSILGITLADEIIPFIFGQEYINAIPVLQIILLGLAFMFIRDVGGSVLAAVDRQRESFLLALVVLIYNIGINAVLIPRLGSIGAAVATASSELLFGLIVAGYLAYKRYPLPYLRLAFKPLLAAGLMALLVRLLPLHVVLKLGIGMLGYLALLTLLSFWDDEELSLLRQTKERVGKRIVLSYRKFTS